jgi:hypothetical protein
MCHSLPLLLPKVKKEKSIQKIMTMRLRSNTNVSDSKNWNNPTSGLIDVLLSMWR